MVLERNTLLNIVDTDPFTRNCIAQRGRGSKMQSTESTIGPYELHDFFLFHLRSPLWSAAS